MIAAAFSFRTTTAGFSVSAWTIPALFSASFRHAAVTKSSVRIGASSVPAKSARNDAPSEPRRRGDVAVAALEDASGRRALGGDVDDDGEDALARNDVREPLDVLDPVLNDGELRVRAEERPDPADGAFDVVRLRDSEDPVDRPRRGRIDEHARRDVERAIAGRLDDEPVERRPRADGHVVELRRREPRREGPADRARSDDRDGAHAAMDTTPRRKIPGGAPKRRLNAFANANSHA
jgi:hypothetical protein